MLQPLIIPCSLPPGAAAWRHLPHAPTAGLPGRAVAWPARAAPAPRRHPAARPDPQTRLARWRPWRPASCCPRGAPPGARAQRRRSPPRGLAPLRRPPRARALSLQGPQALRAHRAAGAHLPARTRQRRARPAQRRPPRRAQAPARPAAARAQARRQAPPRRRGGPRRQRRQRRPAAAAGTRSACPARTAGAARRRSHGGCPRGRPAPAAPAGAAQARRGGRPARRRPPGGRVRAALAAVWRRRRRHKSPRSQHSHYSALSASGRPHAATRQAVRMAAQRLRGVRELRSTLVFDPGWWSGSRRQAAGKRRPTQLSEWPCSHPEPPIDVAQAAPATHTAISYRAAG